MNILIVEDEALLALELESELETAGHTIVGQAMSSAQAKKLADQSRPEFAFVDIHLLDGPSGIDVGRHLAGLGIPYVFVTGNLKRIPEDFAGALGAIEKPYTMNGLQHALGFIERFVSGAKSDPIPPSLVPAPRIKNETRVSCAG
ncbi:response regulator [Rhizobium oryzicola]|uniref:Response regulator n=1 Tax=Rhizobium oryzicola TaxID=1232668 RepID=A0ABT8SQE5_9HYPH|nr:response regulator [Rhizobium oryzicola]MDO1580490.1 response regulator [Rhizobium oryzicola]